MVAGKKDHKLIFLLVYEPDEENCKDDKGDLSLLVKNVRMSNLTPISDFTKLV